MHSLCILGNANLLKIVEIVCRHDLWPFLSSCANVVPIIFQLISANKHKNKANMKTFLWGLDGADVYSMEKMAQCAILCTFRLKCLKYRYIENFQKFLSLPIAEVPCIFLHLLLGVDCLCNLQSFLSNFAVGACTYGGAKTPQKGKFWLLTSFIFMRQQDPINFLLEMD